MTGVTGAAGGTGSGSTLPFNPTGSVVLTFPEISLGHTGIVVILAFISGASFLLLVLILAFFLFCRRRAEEDSLSNTSIIYNIEQDSVSITPSLCKQIEEILLVDDITGLLEPSLGALKAAHRMMEEMVTRKLVLTNLSHLDLLRRSIHHIPVLCDAAIQVGIAL